MLICDKWGEVESYVVQRHQIDKSLPSLKGQKIHVLKKVAFALSS